MAEPRSTSPTALLDREEYVEQAYWFRVLSERLPDNVPLQDVLAQVKSEVLATTKLPIALDFLLAELKHSGAMAPAMERLKHYFAPFQTYVMREAESERGRFDMRVAIEVLKQEALLRADRVPPQTLFMFQFECLCRNRLRYDHGLTTLAEDPVYSEDWREWILVVRRQIGIADLAELIYARSQQYVRDRKQLGDADYAPEKPILFGEKEGKIAFANRRRDPLYFFAALQRHLGYPAVPRNPRVDPNKEILPQLVRRLERLELKLKLIDEEQRGGIDITKFYGTPDHPKLPAVPPPDDLLS
jgi:hypothetical protein